MALVGRDRELARLAGELASAMAGKGGAIAVIGEPGIGKTSLVSELARGTDARVLWGRSSDLGRAEWGPIAQAFAALLDDDVIDAQLAARCGGGLLALVPEAVHVAPALDAPAGADTETVSFAVARAATRLLRHACLQRPHVLVIDDVHDADPASLQLLARLAREARTMALLVVMTAREAELGARTDIAELAREVTLLRLPALDREASSELVRRFGLAGDAVDRVLTVAEGNPLYLSELAALMASRSTGEIPLGIKASIRSRLDRLPAPTRAFVDALAVLGGRDTIERAAEIAGVQAAAASHAFELGIAISTGAHAALSHALVRDVAYAELAAERRARLHRAAAMLTSEPLEHVRHLAAGGAIADAVDAAIAAANRAHQRAADDEAMSVLQIVIEQPVDERHRAELAIALGRAQLRCGLGEAGVASCTRAAAIGERLGDPDLVARAALARGSVFRFGHVDQGLVQALTDAVSHRAGCEDILQARLLARLAGAEQPAADPWPPIARAHEAFTLARRLGDPHALLDVLHDGMAACVDIEDPRKRAPVNRELCDLARRMRAPWYELRALSRLVFDHIDLGESAEADAVIEQLDTVARSFAHPRHQWRVAMVRALRAASDGRWAASDRHVDEAIALGSDDPMFRIALFGNRHGRLRAQERSEEELQLIEEDRDILMRVPEGEALIATLEASVLARAGELDRARSLLPIARRSLVFHDVAFMAMFAEAAAMAGDREACAAVEPMLAERVHRFVNGGPMMMHAGDPIERYLGLVVLARGDRVRAAGHFESALARLRATGSWPFIPRLALELAPLVDDDRAAALRAEAAELVERFELGDLRPRMPAKPSVPEATFALQREGEAWAITSAGKTFRLRDTRGLRILARLVEQPGVDVPAIDLVDGDGTVDRGDAGEMLDARARAEYRARLVDLRDDIAEAERRGDLGWLDRLRTESETLQRELSRAVGKGGKARRAGVAAERARSAVTRRVREAIAKIGEHDRALGEHLEWAVRTGMTCSYRGNP